MKHLLAVVLLTGMAHGQTGTNQTVTGNPYGTHTIMTTSCDPDGTHCVALSSLESRVAKLEEQVKALQKGWLRVEVPAPPPPGVWRRTEPMSDCYSAIMTTQCWDGKQGFQSVMVNGCYEGDPCDTLNQPKK